VLCVHNHAGECGLDFNRNFSPPDLQEQWFAAQVQLALELRKPLFMHCRDAGAKFAEILGAAGFGSSGVPGMLHCFTGNGEELRQCLDLGLHIGITGWVRGHGYARLTVCHCTGC
jgi:TatD DNase family protein